MLYQLNRLNLPIHTGIKLFMWDTKSESSFCLDLKFLSSSPPLSSHVMIGMNAITAFTILHSLIWAPANEYMKEVLFIPMMKEHLILWLCFEQNPFWTQVCRCYSIAFLNRTLMFNWCVVRWGSKNKHHKIACIKEIGLHVQILVLRTH